MSKTPIHPANSNIFADYASLDTPICAIPAAIQSYQMHGITRTQLSSMLINLFYFPEGYKDCLESYYLLHWEGIHLHNSLRNGTIRHNDVDYLVVYQGITPYKARREKQVKLSFRNPKKEFGLQAYVVVRALNQREMNYINATDGA